MTSYVLETFNKGLENIKQELNQVRAKKDNNSVAQKQRRMMDDMRERTQAAEEQQEQQLKEHFPVFMSLVQDLAKANGYALTLTHVWKNDDPYEIESTNVTLRSARFDLSDHHQGKDNIFSINFHLKIDPATNATEMTAMIPLQRGMDKYLEKHDAKPSLKTKDMVMHRVHFGGAEAAIDLLQRWTALQESPEYKEHKQMLKAIQCQTHRLRGAHRLRSNWM